MTKRISVIEVEEPEQCPHYYETLVCSGEVMNWCAYPYFNRTLPDVRHEVNCKLHLDKCPLYYENEVLIK